MADPIVPETPAQVGGKTRSDLSDPVIISRAVCERIVEHLPDLLDDAHSWVGQ